MSCDVDEVTERLENELCSLARSIAHAGASVDLAIFSLHLAGASIAKIIPKFPKASFFPLS